MFVIVHAFCSIFEVLESDIKRQLKPLNAHQRVKASLKQTTGFSHQLAGKQQATGNAIPARLFLRIRKLNEGFGCGMFDKQFSDDFGAVVGHSCFAVGLVEHLVEALGAERALH